MPHFTFSSAAERFPDLLADLEAGRDSPADPAQGQPHPPSFLTADDIDNYNWEIDTRLADKEFTRNGKVSVHLPTLAPLAHPDSVINGTNGAKDAGAASSASRDFVLRNPTSVYNWLRKHAPKTFLQDGETHDKENGDEQHGASARGQGRGKGDRGSTRGAGRSKRASAAHKSATNDSVDGDEDGGYEVLTPSTIGGKGKRKRVVDDDPGYRPKGGSSRPTKKKRKSEGGTDSTPTTGTKRSRKSGLGAESFAD